MQYLAKVNGVKPKDNKTQLLITVSEDITDKVIYLNREGTLQVGVELNDGRRIRTDQRKRIYATLRDISNYTGHDPEYLKELMKYNYCATTGDNYFSLSDCSVTTAREYTNFLVDFIFKWDIPLSEYPIERVEDIDRYLYNCLKYRRCAITGKGGADIHHVTGSRVGMGRNRQKINHADLKLIALSRDWHTKVHAEGEAGIFEKFKIYGVKIDVPTLKNLGIKADEID